MALELLKKLRLDHFFQQALASSRPKIPWAELAKILIVARFCEPKSELHIAEHFYSQTALADWLGIPAYEIYDNRLYRALDHLLRHKDDLQKHLKERFGELFNISYDILLYDITSTYFEGDAEKNPQAKRGHSRDHPATGGIASKSVLPWSSPAKAFLWGMKFSPATRMIRRPWKP